MKTRSPHSGAMLFALTTASLAPMLNGQAPGFTIVPATGTVPAQAAPAAPAAPAPGAQAAQPEPAGDANKSFAAAVAAMKFDRTPESLLQAVQAQQSGKPLNEAERFRIAVILGDWDSVGKALKSLPQREATSAYSRMLTALVEGSQSAAQFYQQAQRGNRPGGNPQENEAARKGLLLSDDFYAVVAASPAPLGAEQIKPVADLVKIAIGESSKKEFLARLQAGLQGIGGTGAEGRVLAARLLSAVGWVTDAAPYLPVERSQWDQADTLSLVLAMEYFTQSGIKERDERQLKRAAEVCAFMMQTSRFAGNDQGLFRQATDRFVQLLPALETDEAEQLIRENFMTQPAILQDLLLVLGEAGQKAAKSQDLNLRAQSLATQHALLGVLGGRKAAPPEAVNLLVTNWLSEAETTYRSAIQPSLDPDGSDDMNTIINNYYSRRNQPDIKVVKPELILPNAPPQALVRRLNKGLAQRVNLTLLKVNLMDPKEPETMQLLTTYLKANPGQEKALCQDYLVSWVRKRSVPAEDPNIVRMRRLGYMIQREQKDAAGGIPLTRLRQNQNVADFKTLLATMRSLSPEPLDPSVVVQGFMAIHSGAEVYQIEDIEAIFGPAEKMEVEELMQLVSGMRGKLKEQWRDDKTQQAAATNRTEKEIKDEVSRGYRTALALVSRGLTPEKADWKQYVVRGQLFFDASEFEFARQIKLSEYVSLRDEAFSSYRKAAEIYASGVGKKPRGQWTTEPYQMWFIAMLGASDLSQLTKSAARSDPGLKQIGDAMRSLPGESAEVHLTQFGQMLSSALSQVPGNLRQQFLAAGLQVLGKDHPAAKVAAKSLANYEELLGEVGLKLTLDGPVDVGHGQPFGVRISIEHTRQLARESGGFSKYLQNGAAPNMYMMGGGQSGQEPPHRDNFIKNIHAALDETFEVVGITFHDPAVKATDLPRAGWQETPVAYLLLRAKEAAVDRIPSIQMDMDFSDTSGRVVLPVRSQVLQISATSANPPARPCPDLALTFTMDEREWEKDGRVVVEVAAKASGVIASHEQLFDFQRPGFDVEVSDGGLSITEFVSGEKGLSVNADRSWQFTYKRSKDLGAERTLKFPSLKPGVQAAKVEYQHYQDADLEPIRPEKAADGIPLKGAGQSTWFGRLAAAVIALAGVAAFYLLRRRKAVGTAVDHRIPPPAEFTPFAVVSFLRRVEHECGTKLDDAARAAIRQEIDDIENSNYRNPPTPTDSKALEATATKWLHAVR